MTALSQSTLFRYALIGAAAIVVFGSLTPLAPSNAQQGKKLEGCAQNGRDVDCPGTSSQRQRNNAPVIGPLQGANDLNGWGMDAFNAGSYDLALSYFDKAYKRYPDPLFLQNWQRTRATMLHQQSIAALDQNEVYEAFHLAERASRYFPTDGGIRSQLSLIKERIAIGTRYNQAGVDAYNANKFVDALAAFKKALEFVPNDEGVKRNIRSTEAMLPRWGGTEPSDEQLRAIPPPQNEGARPPFSEPDKNDPWVMRDAPKGKAKRVPKKEAAPVGSPKEILPQTIPACEEAFGKKHDGCHPGDAECRRQAFHWFTDICLPQARPGK